MPSQNPSRARKLARGALIIGVAIATGVGWLFTRPDGSRVFIPYPESGVVVIDAPIDAAPDSAIDAPPPEPPIPMNDVWPRHAILSVATGSTLKGADGVHARDINGDGLLDLTVSWEQSGKTSVSLHPGYSSVDNAWPSVTLPLTTSGVEDAAFGDVDGDGRIDVVSCGSSSFRLYAHFAPASNNDLLTPASWASVTVSAASNVQRFIKALVIDIDQTGGVDIVAGGYSTGASLDIYRSGTPRVGTSWTRETISTAGAVISLEPRDMDGDGDQDIVMTDRFATGALNGVRWMKNPTIGGGSWTSISIYQVSDARWMSISADGKTIVLGTSNVTPPSTTFILTCNQATPSLCNSVTPGTAPAWQKTLITEPTGAGLFNQGRLGDIDMDGDDDIVIVYHHAYDELSNVLWLRNDGGGVYTRGEISGVEGVKSDNYELFDVDGDGDLDAVVTDEGVRGDATVVPLGLVWYENRFGVI